LPQPPPTVPQPSPISSLSPRVVRILIVDDSAVVRTLLRTVVSSDSRLEVAGTASDGASALLALDSLQPDLVLLDVEMPGMDGLSTLKQMRTGRRLIPVIMCSALTQRGAKVTIEALASGAADYVAKPSGQSSREAAMQVLAQDLIPKILALTGYVATPKSSEAHTARGNAGAFGSIAPASPHAAFPAGPVRPGVAQAGPSAQTNLISKAPVAPLAGLANSLTQANRETPSRWSSPAVLPQPAPQTRSSAPAANGLPAAGSATPAVLLIGVSTGGPAALDALLPALPGDFPLPILIVQHMPELFTSLLADRLNDRCALRVREATSGEPVCRGSVYIARGDWHMEVVAGGLIHTANCERQRTQPFAAGTDPAAVLRLNQLPRENHCRPAVDVLFRSAANVFGGRVLGVVLTGMGSDGLIGSRPIRERGGTILAQDQATSAVWGMPGAVVQAGLAQRVVPLNAMAAEILRLASRGQREAAELRESTVTP
jgi:two-component system chemotaxis response regulator CheB